MKKYDQYKNSGVEWLGEIPEHWEVKKLKYSSSIYNGDSLNESKKTKFESDNLDDLAYISSKDIDLETSNITYENGLRIPQNESKYKVAPKESSLICIEGGSAGRKIAFSNQDICFVNKLACVKAKNNLNSKFIYHTLKGSLFQTQFKLSMSGMIGGVAISSINNFYILNPPIQEQTEIVNFLDDKTTKIDQAIAIKQNQIELLKERRQILIHKAVTKGLNDKVKLKDSGVEWIGEIPEHWEVSRLKNYMTMITGFPFKSEKYTEEGIKLARGINVKEGVLNWNETRCWPTLEPHLVDYLLKDGDVLIAMDGSKVGKNFCQVKESDLPILLLQRVARLRTKTSLLSSFLYSHIINRNFLQWVEMTKTDPMVPHISPDDIKNFQITVVPISEQKQIVEFIIIGTTKIATAISLKEQEIEKLKEYKMSLIDGVVTGKVRVC